MCSSTTLPPCGQTLVSHDQPHYNRIRIITRADCIIMRLVSCRRLTLPRVSTFPRCSSQRTWSCSPCPTNSASWRTCINCAPSSRGRRSRSSRSAPMPRRVRTRSAKWAAPSARRRNTTRIGRDVRRARKRAIQKGDGNTGRSRVRSTGMRPRDRRRRWLQWRHRWVLCRMSCRRRIDDRVTRSIQTIMRMWWRLLRHQWRHQLNRRYQRCCLRRAMFHYCSHPPWTPSGHPGKPTTPTKRRKSGWNGQKLKGRSVFIAINVILFMR